MHIETWHITGTSFHFGLHGLGQEQTAIHFSSDSLFAALVYRLRELRGEEAVAEFMAPFNNSEPPFVLTSGFPFAGGVRFFPVPAVAIRGAEDDDVSVKSLKKVSFVSQDIFQYLLKGKRLAEHYSLAHKLQSGQVLVSPEEVADLPKELQIQSGNIWAVEQRPRVTLERLTSRSTIFFTGQLLFGEKCGLWFGVRWMDKASSMRELMPNLLFDLATAGLGGERSVGFGACKIEQARSLELPEARGRKWVSLSRYLPRADEIHALNDPMAAYKVEQVGGWLDSPQRRGQRRRAVNLLAEASVLGALDREVPGQIVDVRPSYLTDRDPLGHPVYRCGLAFAVGLEGGEA